MKKFITPDELRKGSFDLAKQVVDDGFRPDFMVALWRGGAPIGCYVHEYLKYKGINTDHIAIRTSRYTGIDQVKEEIEVHSTSYLTEKVKPGNSILIVDDVWDSGHTIVAVLNKLISTLPAQVDIRVACLYYKPARNHTYLEPAYYTHLATEWLVFPHELEGLTQEEIDQHIFT